MALLCYHPFAHAGHGENVNSTRFWAVLLQNSVFLLLVVNAAMFFICVTTMAMGGWQVAFRRVPEAISSVVPVLGIITFVILMCYCIWATVQIFIIGLIKMHVANDQILNGKKGFLNPTFFTIWSSITIFLWWFLGQKMRSLKFGK